MNFIAALVTAYVLGKFVAGSENVQAGLETASWLWLGFIVTLAIGSVCWEGKKWSVFFVNVLYSFVQLLVMAAILVSWV